jgi:cyclic lactone autoinducer peptide
MKNTKEIKNTEKGFKAVAAKMFSKFLVKEAEKNVRVSIPFGIYEPEFPIELMQEDDK